MNESDLERRVADVLRKRSEDAMRAVHVEEDLDKLRRRAKWEARSHRTLGVAAVLVILVAGAGAAVLLPERGSSAPDSADAAAPSASADATPTAAPPAGPAASIDPLLGGWRPSPNSSGTFVGFFPGVSPRVEFSYTLPDGWAKIDMSTVRAPNAVVAFRHVGNVYADGCRWTLQDPPLGPTVDDLAKVWGELPGFTATTPVDITVDGYAGKRVDFTVPDYDKTKCVADEFVLWHGTPGKTQAPRTLQGAGEWARVPEQQNHQWIIDVDGTRLVITEWFSPGTTPEQLASMDQFLASVQIG